MDNSNSDDFEITIDDLSIQSSSQLPLFGNDVYTVSTVIGSSNSNSISVGANGANANGTIYTTGSGTSGGYTFQPYTQTTSPYIYSPSSSGTITIGGNVNIAPNNNDKYAVFKLPRKRIPEAVYVSGRMVTLGLLGTDVECAFIGDSLIFSPNVLCNMRFNERITLILQYANMMFHYKVHHSFGMVEMLPDSNMVKTTLLSEVKRGENV